MTGYEYDENLPYVVEYLGEMDARFRTYEAAEVFIAEEYPAMNTPEIIDTTPKPQVPEDAKFITWLVTGHDRWYAERRNGDWIVDGASYGPALEDLPGVAPDTVFTVLDERKTND